MLNVKKKWRGYFTFSKRERNVGLVLLCMIIIVTVLPSFTGLIAQPVNNIDNQLIAQLEIQEQPKWDAIDSSQQQNKYFNTTWQSNNKSFPKNNYQAKPIPPITLFEFNPNTISKSQWEQLGVAPYLAQRLSNYTAKGGKFKSKEDLLKTYGFTLDDLARLNDYIIFDTVQNTFSEPSESIMAMPENPQITELNTATKEQLLALGFSGDNVARIIKFRENAGGIYAPDQLESVFGIDMEILESRKQYLIADANLIEIINVNTADVTKLAQHIYISDELAQEIVLYRNNTGKFYSLTELRKVKGMYATVFEKLKPYLTL
jgi:competence protein ComEA